MQGSAGSVSHISQGVIVRGEVSGTEDLYVDGEVDGTIHLSGNLCTIGPNGTVKANVQAFNIVVLGRVEGNLHASERIELRKSAVVVGDIAGGRIVIEEGAFLKGSVDIRKDAPQEAAKDIATVVAPQPSVSAAITGAAVVEPPTTLFTSAAKP